MKNQFTCLSEYELRHLITHLVEAKRIQDIHRLLSLETQEGKNAWHEAKVSTIDLNSYLQDITSTLSFMSDYWQEDRTIIGMQVRYNLVISSIHSSLSNISVEKLISLVEKGKLNIKRAIEYAKLIPYPEPRFDALLSLLNLISLEEYADLALELFETIELIGHDTHRAQALRKLVKYLPSSSLERALIVARDIQDDEERAYTLLLLIAQTDILESMQIANEIIDIVEPYAQKKSWANRILISLPILVESITDNILIRINNILSQSQLGNEIKPLLNQSVNHNQNMILIKKIILNELEGNHNEPQRLKIYLETKENLKEKQIKLLMQEKKLLSEQISLYREIIKLKKDLMSIYELIRMVKGRVTDIQNIRIRSRTCIRSDVDFRQRKYLYQKLKQTKTVISKVKLNIQITEDQIESLRTEMKQNKAASKRNDAAFKRNGATIYDMGSSKTKSTRENNEQITDYHRITSHINDNSIRTKTMATLAKLISPLKNTRSNKIRQSPQKNTKQSSLYAPQNPKDTTIADNTTINIDVIADTCAYITKYSASNLTYDNSSNTQMLLEFGFLVTVLPKLSGNMNQMVSQIIIDNIQKLESYKMQSEILIDSIKSSTEQFRFKFIKKALEIIKANKNNNVTNRYGDSAMKIVRAEMLKKLAIALVEVDYVQEALDVAKATDLDDIYQAEAFEQVATLLIKKGHIQEAFEAIREIRVRERRDKALKTIVPHLVKLPEDILYSIWQASLPMLAARGRKDLLADLLILAPLIYMLGTIDAVHETIRAIEKVSNWWP